MTDPIRQDNPVNSKSPFTIAPILKARSVFQKWLHLPEPEVVDLIISIPASLKVLKSEPIWLLLKGVPGSGKTELINSLSKLDNLVHSVSSLSPAALISGYTNTKDPTKDYSLLPQLEGKTLLIKDLTTVISMPVPIRDQVFGILRDVYDGTASRAFGTGVKSYTSKFNIVAGVTSVIENIHHFNSLGERFITWKINIDYKEHGIKALTNFNKEDQMREEIQNSVADVVTSTPDTIPFLPENMTAQFYSLAYLSCKLRAYTGRGHTQTVSQIPESEAPTRVMKQLIRLCQGVALVRHKSKITKSEFSIARKVAMDSMPLARTKAFNYLYTSNKSLDISNISDYLKISPTPTRLLLDDFKLLGIVNVSKSSKKVTYTLTDYIRNMWTNLQE